MRTSSASAGIQESSEEKKRVIGYIYPHFPVELVLAHGLVPSLISTNPETQGAFENSLQTFACGYVRNLFSRRVRGELSSLSGLVFPSNTCDSLQNAGDIWRYRFPEDVVFKVTYPVSDYGKASVKFLAEELKILSDRIEREFGVPFSNESFKAAVEMINGFRESLQMIYSARVIMPSIITYHQLMELTRQFLTEPTRESLDEINRHIAGSLGPLSTDIINDFRELKQMMQRMRVEREFDVERDHPRIAMVGGMTDPQLISQVLHELGEGERFSLVIDLLSFGFKCVFSPQIQFDSDPFVEMAKNILSTPKEPTQEGLTNRLIFLRETLVNLKIEGLIILEQSFCDPDEFEAPSLERVAKEESIPVVRLPIDPELSDQERVKLRLQSFLENLLELV